ncbi:MAG: hypothetical protein FWH11_14570 [Micrococcales bacterium]|nr:hypothetical protein [Micrococcales bacterium]
MSSSGAFLRHGDDLMRQDQPAAALREYQEAWPLTHTEGTAVKERVWVLLSIANAAVRTGEFDEAFDALVGAHSLAEEAGNVVGNPMFHLLAGLTYAGLDENSELMVDNFARALICGGPAMFVGEDPRHLNAVQQILRPPAELGRWEGYEGCSRDQMNDVTGYLRELLTARLGSPPPWI